MMQIMKDIKISAVVHNCFDPYFKHYTTECQIHVVDVLGVKAWMSNHILCSFEKMLSNQRTSLSSKHSKHIEAGKKYRTFADDIFEYIF